MPRISFVRDTHLNIEYGFMFDIRSTQELEDWWENIKVPSMKEEFRDALHCSEINPGSMRHATKGASLAALCQVSGKSLLDTFICFSEQTYIAMSHSIQKSKAILVNSVGGFFVPTLNTSITNTHEIENWILPDEKVRILTWSGGKHFYAKIGNLDIVVDGIQKWNTKEAALAAADKFLSRPTY